MREGAETDAVTDTDCFEIDLDPDIPDTTFILIGRIAVEWARFENEVQWQCVVEAQKVGLFEIDDKDVFRASIEPRLKAFLRLRRERIGLVEGSKLDEFKEVALQVAKERSRLLHGDIYADGAALKVCHQPVKPGEDAVHLDVEPEALRYLLGRCVEVRRRFENIISNHRQI